MVNRYGVFSCDIYEYPKGDMVCYKDYADLEQENAKLKGALETIIDEAGCCTGEDALNMLRTAEHAIKSITGGE